MREASRSLDSAPTLAERAQERSKEPLREAPSVLAEVPLKRPFDIVLAVVGLILSAPLWLAAALAIKLEDRGPILYRQTRWGRGGRCFEIMKFRTMTPDSDERFGIVQAAIDDDRITRVGRVLRATGIDELPQLLNIFKGQMSLVGPRALALGEYMVARDGTRTAYEDSPLFFRRLSVRPGLTGPATIFLPKDAQASAKFELDLDYIDNRSLWVDIRLVALSLWVSVRGKWEVRTAKL